MFARVTSFTGTSEQIDTALELFRDQVLPWLRDATGFRGWLGLNDRDAGRTLAITFWATEEAARDQAVSGGNLRDELAATVGMAKHAVEIYEVALVEPLQLGES